MRYGKFLESVTTPNSAPIKYLPDSPYEAPLLPPTTLTTTLKFLVPHFWNHTENQDYFSEACKVGMAF